MSSKEKTPSRHGRVRELSLKATENFNQNENTYKTNIDYYCEKIDRCIDQLEDRSLADDMDAARKIHAKASYNFTRYTLNCDKLAALYLSTDTNDARILHEQLLENQQNFSTEYDKNFPNVFDLDNGSQYAPTVPSHRSFCHSNRGSQKSCGSSHKSSDSQLAARLAAADAAEAKARLEASKLKTALTQKQAFFEADKLKNQANFEPSRKIISKTGASL